jgi:hypothetical protein
MQAKTPNQSSLKLPGCPHLITWLHMEVITPGITQMTNNHDILHQEYCKAETALNFCKTLYT